MLLGLPLVNFLLKHLLRNIVSTVRIEAEVADSSG